MKKIKNFAAFLTALVTIFAMSVSSLAATIDVTGGQEGQVYYAYLIFDLESSGTSYTYTIDADSEFIDLVKVCCCCIQRHDTYRSLCIRYHNG